MKKIICFITLLTTLICILAACGVSSTDDSSRNGKKVGDIGGVNVYATPWPQ